MRKIYYYLTLGCLAFAGINSASGLPAKPGLITVKQPDGTEIKVRMEGDAFNHFVYNEKGQLLSLNEEGFYVESKLTEEEFLQAKERRAVRKNQGLMTKHFPSIGQQRVLVILAEFSNSKFKVEEPKDFYYRMLNQVGFNEYGATGSAFDYFFENSGGKFMPQFDVYGPVTLSRTDSFYGEDDAFGLENNAYQMIIEACEMLDGEIDFTKYDADNDGIIDNVYVFYAGKGQADGGGATTVWPHAGDIYTKLHQNVSLDGKILDHYACSNEWQNAKEQPDGIGSFCHEFGHVLGLPDLYSTNGRAVFHPYYWDIMSLGSYNNDSRTPPNYSSYERYALGWLEPEVLPSGTVTIEPLGNSNMAYIIPTDIEDEYFLFENRQLNGWDAYLPGHGMLVWHIDYDVKAWDSNTVNNSATYQAVDLIEADDIKTTDSYAGDPFPGSSNNTQFTYDSTPSLRNWGGRNRDDHTGYAINNIEETGDGLIKLNVEYNDPAAIDGIMSEIENFVFVSGNTISTSENGVKIYDISGRIIATINAESLSLPSGIYIAVKGDKHVKFIVR